MTLTVRFSLRDVVMRGDTYSSQSSACSNQSYFVECTPLQNGDDSSEEGSMLDYRQNANPSEFFAQSRINLFSVGSQTSSSMALAARENLDDGEYLLQNGHCYAESKALCVAINNKSTLDAEKLLKKYVGVKEYGEWFHAYFDTDQQRMIQNIALHCAVQKADSAVIKNSFNHGADVHGRHAVAGTMLHAALQRGNFDIIKIFLQKYINPKIDFEIYFEAPCTKEAYCKILEDALLCAVQRNDSATLGLLLTPYKEKVSNMIEIRKPSSHMLFNILTRLSNDIEVKDSAAVKILSECLINALKEEKKSYFNREDFGKIKEAIKNKKPIFAKVMQRVAAFELFPRGFAWLGRACIGLWASFIF